MPNIQVHFEWATWDMNRKIHWMLIHSEEKKNEKKKKLKMQTHSLIYIKITRPGHEEYIAKNWFLFFFR